MRGVFLTFEPRYDCVCSNHREQHLYPYIRWHLRSHPAHTCDPPSFTEIAILGYVDFVSVILAIGITIIATGITRSDSPGGLGSSDWSAWPQDDLSFTQALVALSNIVFSYAFAASQFSFMSEMHTPKDFTKSIVTLGITEIVLNTITGAVIYAFVGQSVESPALLSASPLVSKVAFGVVLPVIYISGSINATVAYRFIHGRMYKDSVARYVNTTKGWITWLGVVTCITVLSWLIAKATPFFLGTAFDLRCSLCIPGSHSGSLPS